MLDFISEFPPIGHAILLILIIVIATFVVSSPTMVNLIKKLYYSIKRLKGKEFKDIKTYEDLNEILKTYGYSYDFQSDTFFSIHDAWQRKMGYTRIYDEAAAPMSMIIDCEPIYFQYDNKRWLIQFWKGQYGMTTGGEVGVYYTDELDSRIQEIDLNWYQCAEDDEMLKMDFVLVKDRKSIIKRTDVHWWLTGFKLGEFSNPDQLSMYLSINLKNKEMRDEFIKGLNKAGYRDNEIIVFGNSVGLEFYKPKTTQPYTRIKKTDEITQMKNKLLCDKYQEITSGYDNLLDKISAVQRVDPELFMKLFNMGKSSEIFAKGESLKIPLE